jgi:hypothetical protein
MCENFMMIQHTYLFVYVTKKTSYKAKCGVVCHFCGGVLGGLFIIACVVPRTFRLWVVECANVYIVRKCAILRILMYGVCVRALL